MTDLSKEAIKIKMALQTLDVYKRFIADPLGMTAEDRCSVLIAAVIAHMASDMLLEGVKECLQGHVASLEDMA